MAFPDPTCPIATCIAGSCVDYPVSEKVHCHFRPKDLIHFLLISFPGFIVGGAVIFAFNQWLAAVYMAIIVGFFGFFSYSTYLQTQPCIQHLSFFSAQDA